VKIQFKKEELEWMEKNLAKLAQKRGKAGDERVKRLLKALCTKMRANALWVDLDRNELRAIQSIASVGELAMEKVIKEYESRGEPQTYGAYLEQAREKEQLLKAVRAKVEAKLR